MGNVIQVRLANDAPSELRAVPVGSIRLGDLEPQPNQEQYPNSVSVDVEATPGSPALTLGTPPQPWALRWLSLSAEVTPSSQPYHPIGRIVIDQPADASFVPGRSMSARWRWEFAEADIARMEAMRSNRTHLLNASIEIRGIAAAHPYSAQHQYPLGGEVTVAAQSGRMAWQIEPSQWDRFLQASGYGLPSDYRNLAGRSVTDHPSWKEAGTKLQGAIEHLRAGEDDDALRECLNVLEAIVSPPYAATAWENQLGSLPPQKANALAELFSGFATYCNRVGHHRDRADRDGDGDLRPMPLDHWEAELAVGQAHFILAYAIRLRTAGTLSA